jgi:hypothetical protein
MIDLMFPHCQDVYEHWSHAVAGLVWNQWKVLDAQYAAGIELLDAVAGGLAATGATLQTLKENALERTRKGLPPPREVYESQNRGRIDWSQFPEWARPIDPEVFEGSAHEG